ncbi:MAG: argininosuccinate lyase [Zetaproteobacteria bacterium]|nr:argininosuccinate lyase [Zetaproteobacteria bacterium]
MGQGILGVGVNATQSPQLFEYTQGLDVDRLFAAEEVQVQQAWVVALAEEGTLSAEEARQLHQALAEVLAEMQAGTFPWHIEDEDIHMNIERALGEKVGPEAKKIHTGRSRNDLVATTLRLYVARQMGELRQALVQLQQVLQTLAQQHQEVLLPGMTHLQFGQPTRLGHVISAHIHSLRADEELVDLCLRRCLAYCPLGAGAFAGTHLQVDLTRLAQQLGFAAPCPHSYHAVGDRDFMLTALSAMQMLATHVGRLCEEWLFFSSSAVGVLCLPPRWSSGSSMMPNKRNPDVLEISRARVVQILHTCAEGFAIVRGVIPSYGSDLHELKRTFVRAHSLSATVLQYLRAFAAELEVNPDACAQHLGRGHILATELANQLTAQGTPFREAYTQVAAWVAQAEAEGVQVHQLAAAAGVDFMQAVEKRTNCGGSAREQALQATQAEVRSTPE